jgi:indolepyruvate ferredoxin oxidoreductase, beta subunit
LLRCMARMRPMRRKSMRFVQEHEAMSAWWAAMQDLAPRSASMGLALAGLPQVLKGYGDTQKRGRESYERIWNECVAPALNANSDLEVAAEKLSMSLKATLADPEGHLNGRVAVAHPIKWFKSIPVSIQPTS